MTQKNTKRTLRKSDLAVALLGLTGSLCILGAAGTYDMRCAIESGQTVTDNKGKIITTKDIPSQYAEYSHLAFGTTCIVGAFLLAKRNEKSK
ncbi:MAG: hypothetical protein ACLRFK_03615 [Alphaproteobacteria bacterium]